MKQEENISISQFLDLKTRDHLLAYLDEHKEGNSTFKKVLFDYWYEQELLKLQAELVDFQRWVQR